MATTYSSDPEYALPEKSHGKARRCKEDGFLCAFAPSRNASGMVGSIRYILSFGSSLQPPRTGSHRHRGSAPCSSGAPGSQFRRSRPALPQSLPGDMRKRLHALLRPFISPPISARTGIASGRPFGKSFSALYVRVLTTGVIIRTPCSHEHTIPMKQPIIINRSAGSRRAVTVVSALPCGRPGKGSCSME